jgi:hypothetical protein
VDFTQLKDEVRIVGTQRDKFTDEQDVPISSAQLTDEDLKTVKKMRDSLKLELENFRAQYQEEDAQLEDQLYNVRTQCHHFI